MFRSNPELFGASDIWNTEPQNTVFELPTFKKVDSADDVRWHASNPAPALIALTQPSPRNTSLSNVYDERRHSNSTMQSLVEAKTPSNVNALEKSLDPSEGGSTTEDSPTGLCRHFQQGRCNRRRCRFIHQETPHES
jgi:hypothetical protein